MLEKMKRPGTKAKAKSWWQWNKAKGKAKRDWTQFRAKRKMQKMPWLGMAGSLIGGAAGLLALFAVKKRMAAGKERYAQSGQAPSRSHIRMASHPASAGHGG